MSDAEEVFYDEDFIMEVGTAAIESTAAQAAREGRATMAASSCPRSNATVNPKNWNKRHCMRVALCVSSGHSHASHHGMLLRDVIALGHAHTLYGIARERSKLDKRT